MTPSPGLWDSIIYCWRACKHDIHYLYPALGWQVLMQLGNTFQQVYYPLLMALLLKGDIKLLLATWLFFSIALKNIMLLVDCRMHNAFNSGLVEFEYAMRGRSIEHIAYLGEAFHAANSPAKIQTRAVFTSEKITGIIETLYWNFWGHSLRLVFAISSVLLIALDPLLIIVTFATICGFFVSTLRMNRFLAPARRKRIDAEEACDAISAQIIYGSPVLTRHTAMKRYIDKMYELHSNVLRGKVKELEVYLSFRKSGLMRDLFVILGSAGILIITIYRFAAGLIRYEELFIVINMINQIFSEIWAYSEVIRTILNNFEHFQRVIQLRLLPRVFASHTGTARLDASHGFAYQGDVIVTPGNYEIPDLQQDEDEQEQRVRLPILKIHNLHIKAGEKIGLVGSTGAGKSTLIKVLAGIIPVDSDLRINGVPHAEISIENYAQQVAIISQEIIHLNATVRSNLTLGAEVDETDLWAALESAQLADSVHAWGGLDVAIGENGRQLSGGERQRLEIARTLLRLHDQNIGLIVIDEATASLDNQTERLVQSKLDELTHGRTSVIIAHRLSTVMNCDRIIVMEEGKIVEQGSPESLMNTKGHFATMAAIAGISAS